MEASLAQSERKIAISLVDQADDGVWPARDGLRRIHVHPGSNMNDAGKLLAVLRLSGANIDFDSMKGNEETGYYVDIREPA
jgi:hypothetical protein